MITILGPTATGKTTLAARLAYELEGEIISADSRQVYRGMNIGAGKDYSDYLVNGVSIPYHLIDIADPGYEYNIFEFQRDFLKSYTDIFDRKKLPILCGGSGLYLESVLKGYYIPEIISDKEFDKSLESKSDIELKQLLLQYLVQHNTSDMMERKRLIRAVKIGYSQHLQKDKLPVFPLISSFTIGIRFERSLLRQRITERLVSRLKEGMIEEINDLLKKGYSSDQLRFYGLEYRYLTDYVTGKTDYGTMFNLLNIAIHQFAKRQMTWFRKMERDGFAISWIDGTLEMSEKVRQVKSLLDQYQR